MAKPEMLLQAAIFLSFVSPQQARRYFIEFQQQDQKNFFLWVQEKGYLTAQQLTQIQQHLQIQKSKVTSETNQIAESFFAPSEQNPCFEETVGADPQASGFTAGTQFNHYIIQKELGKGGMGIVYQALDRRLQRVVAIKVIRSDVQLTTQQVEQFLAEARAVAQIDHPSIVKIYEIGNTPQHYLAMEYIPGKTLKEVKSNKWNPKKIAAFIRQCALALDFVHNKNIIHRDLKPSNIILDQAEKPKITDFGLAKEINRKKEGSSGFIGTPAYASPEQVRGAKNISYATDVYSLGAVLYELLTQRPPYQGEVFNIFFQILNSDLIAPRSLNPDIPKELEAICLKAMHKTRKNRYRNMRAFARDLQNYMENKPVAAKPPSYLGKCAKLVWRNKLVSSLIICTFLASVITILYLLRIVDLQKSLSELQKEEQLLADKIVQQEGTIAAQEQKIQKQSKKFYQQEITQIHNQIESAGNSSDVEERLQNIAQPDRFEWRWLQKKRDTSLHSFYYNEQAVYSFFEADGKVRSFYTHHVHLWKPTIATQTQSDRQKIVYQEQVANCVLLSPNRKICAYFYTRGIIRLEDLQAKKSEYIQVFNNGTNSIFGASFHADSKSLVAWGRGFIHVVDCVNRKLKLTIDIMRLGVNNRYYSCQLVDDQLLFCWHSSIYRVYLSKIKKTQLFVTEGMRKNLISRLSFSNLGLIVHLECAGNLWVIASTDNIYLYNIKNRKTVPLQTTKNLRRYLNFSISHNKKYLVSWVDNHIDLWSIDSKQLVHSFVGHAFKVNACNFSQDDKILFSHGADGTVKMWEVEKRDFVNYGDTELHRTCVIDNLMINVGPRKITIWDLQRQKLLAYYISIHQYYSVCANKTGEKRYTIVTGHTRNSGLSVFTWDGKNIRLQKFYDELHGQLSKQPLPEPIHHKVYRCFFIDYEDRQLLVTAYLNEIFIWEKHLWQGNKATPLQMFTCSSLHIRDVVYNKKQRCFAVTDKQGLHLWKPFTTTPQTIHSLPEAGGEKFCLTAVAWGDENRVVVGNAKGDLFMIDIAQQRVDKTFHGHFDIIKRCVIDKNCTRLISTDAKGNAYLWDLDDAEREVTPLLKLKFRPRLIGGTTEMLNRILFVENQKNGIEEHVLLTSREATYILHAPYPISKKQKK